MKTDIPRLVKNTINEHSLIKKGDRVLIGLSGGADSTALLHVLFSLSKELEFEIACAHVNHSLRETADRDMNFCMELCRELGVKLYCMRADIRGGAKDAGESEELYARKVRYDYFSSLGFDKIATAHNRNDCAETLLFNFMRGASVKGLSGIPYVRGNIIRPLLDVKKEEIIGFCREKSFEFVTDETNFEAIYTRNKIRLELLPWIEREINPNFMEVATQNARTFAEDSAFLEKTAQGRYEAAKRETEAESVNSINIKALNTEAPIARRILQIYWREQTGVEENLGLRYIEAILVLAQKGQSGSKLDLPKGFEAKIEYGSLIVEKRRKNAEFEYKIFPNEILNIPEIGKNILIYPIKCGGDFYLADTEGLTVRGRRPGDSFMPRGMDGTKKLSDFFGDKKIPRAKRGEIPLLLKDGKIVSVGGMRSDRRFFDTAQTAYKIKITEAENAE